MGTYNASLYNKNETVLEKIRDIEEYLEKNPNVSMFGYNGVITRNQLQIPRSNVVGTQSRQPLVFDIVLATLDTGETAMWQIQGMTSTYYIGELLNTITAERGKDGAPGRAATITIGTITTAAPGTPAAVTNSGTENAAILNFTIPKGADGAPGTGGVGDLNNSEFVLENITNVVYDSVNGCVLTVSGVMNTPNSGSLNITTNIKIPLIPGDNITIDAAEDNKHLVVKSRQLVNGGTSELTDKVSPLESGTIYVYYEE